MKNRDSSKEKKKSYGPRKRKWRRVRKKKEGQQKLRPKTLAQRGSKESKIKRGCSEKNVRSKPSVPWVQKGGGREQKIDH